jgi:hypothetical protein
MRFRNPKHRFLLAPFRNDSLAQARIPSKESVLPDAENCRFGVKRKRLRLGPKDN